MHETIQCHICLSTFKGMKGKEDTCGSCLYEIMVEKESIEPDTNNPSQFPADGNDMIDYR